MSSLYQPMAWQHGATPSFNILSVEDSQLDIFLIKSAMASTSAAYRVCFVTDGADAMDFLFQRGKYVGAERPDLILLDLNVPKADGFEILQAAKNSRELADIPVVVLSTSCKPGHVKACKNLKAADFVTKPLLLADFERVMKRILNRWLPRKKVYGTM